MRRLGGLTLLVALALPAARAPAPGDAPVALLLRGVPADAALAALATEAGVDLVYSPALVGARPVWCGGAGWTADRVLRCITDAVGLDFVRRSSGTVVVTERVVEAAPPARGLGVWGRSWTFRRAYYDVLPALGVTQLGAFTLDRPEADRLPPRLAFDVGIALARTVAGARVELAADVANVLGRRDVLDWWLHPDADGALVPVTRTLPGRQPSLRLRVTR